MWLNIWCIYIHTYLSLTILIYHFHEWFQNLIEWMLNKFICLIYNILFLCKSIYSYPTHFEFILVKLGGKNINSFSFSRNLVFIFWNSPKKETIISFSFKVWKIKILESNKGPKGITCNHYHVLFKEGTISIPWRLFVFSIIVYQLLGN